MIVQQPRCLVLGSHGFLGRNVVFELARSGVNTRSFARSATRVGLEQTGESAETFYGNFLAPEHLARALEGCDSCVHLITTTFPRTANNDIVFDVESNLVGTLRLLELVRQSGCKKVVYVSSGGTVYGPTKVVPIKEETPLAPISAYGLTKATVERYLDLYRTSFGVNSVALRVANPYGPLQRSDGSQGLIASFLRAALEHRPVHIYGDGSQQRDYVYISDVAVAVRLALESKSQFDTFNIGSGVGHSILHILELIEAVVAREIQVEYVPANSADVSVNYLDSTLARRELGWLPEVNLDEGIKRTYLWLTENYGR